MITEFVVDGVPALFSPAPGDVQAGLTFRVGQVDEPLARRGLTHLVEHLALHGLALADHSFNGTTSDEFTSFHMRGSPDQVVRFLAGVCAALHNLPMQRMAVEKDLLRAESNGRGEALDHLGIWRHGARDYGAAGYPELGLSAITEDDLRAWTARYFTRDNAVLWISGDRVPEGLRLALPPGRREPLPVPSNRLPATPAFFEGPPNMIGWTTMVRWGAASVVFAGVLERAMFRELRQEGGLSYTATATSRPIGRDALLISAVADAVPESGGAVLGGFTDVLAALRVGRIDPADVEYVIRRRCEELRQAEERGLRLAGQASGLLLGRPVQPIEAALAETAAVTPADLHAVAGAACAAGLLMTPDGTTADWAGFTPVSATSESVVLGDAYPALTGADYYLIVAPEGVTLVLGDNKRRTVRFDACAIIRTWPDGDRQLIGHDGLIVTIDPSRFRDGRQAVSRLDALLPPHLRVDQPSRGPAPAPVATVAMPPRPPQPPPRRQLTARGMFLAFLTVVAALRAVFLLSTKGGGMAAGGAVLAVAVIAGVRHQISSNRRFTLKRRT